MRHTVSILTSITLLTGLIACGNSEEGAWATVAAADLDAAQTAQLESASGARNALMKGLMGELMGSIQTSGPSGAIDVCSDLAPRLAKEIGTEHGLTIGRTSTKLRNPSNAAPEWAASVIEELGPPEKEVTVAHTDGRLGTLSPIFVMPACLACHGSADELGPGVGEALAKSYPDDHAMDYAAGDLRGWFWVEVPAPKN